MAFPNTPVLDNFNRSNQGPPPSSSWSGPYYGDPDGLIVAGNLCRGNNSSFFNSNYWNVFTVSDPCEIYVDISVHPNNGQDLWLEFVSGTLATPNGYGIDYHFNGTDGKWQFTKFTNGAQATLNSLQTITGGFVNGDGWGFGLNNGVLSAYRRSSGTWSSLGTATDNTYKGPFNLGLEMNGTTTTIDNFGGGSVPHGRKTRIIGRVSMIRSSYY